MSDLPDEGRLGMLAAQLLADAAFVFAEPSDTFAPGAGSLFVARIPVVCRQRWELVVVSEAGLARSLAANLLGIEEDTEEAQKSCADALGEWLNIFAGSVAVECEGPGRIGIPVVTTQPGANAGPILGKSIRRANLVTENGQHLAIGLGLSELA